MSDKMLTDAYANIHQIHDQAYAMGIADERSRLLPVLMELVAAWDANREWDEITVRETLAWTAARKAIEEG